MSSYLSNALDGTRRAKVYPLSGSAAAHRWTLLAHGVGIQLPGDTDAEQTDREETDQVPPVLAGKDRRGAQAGTTGSATSHRVRQVCRV